MSGATGKRWEREVELAGGRWLALEAWRARSGLRLLYFLPLEDGKPGEDDRRDRRVALEPGVEPSSLDASGWEELWSLAVGLTETERRFVDTEGTVWLAQNSGPVWAEGEVAEGLTGIVFTRLTGSWERRTAPGGQLAGMSEGELGARLAAAPEPARTGPGEC